MSAMIKVTQIKSSIACPPNQKENLKGLGFKKINHTVQLQDTPAVRGMIAKVAHLVRIEKA